MAKRFLTDINLRGNQIIQASLEKRSSDPVGALGDELFEGRLYYNTTLDIVKVYDGTKWVDSSIPIVASDPSTGNYEGRVVYNTTENMTKSFDGTSWTAAGTVQDVQAGTDIDVSASNGIYTVSLEAEISSNTTGNAATATYATTAGTANAVAANSVTLGTDTTGNYVSSVSGTTNEIEVTGTAGEGATFQIGLPDSVQITTDLTVGGNLTVNGTTTTLNTTELLVEDNLITLNSGVTGTPTLNAGIEVERGTSANVVIRWNESTDTWELTRDGTNYEEITTVGTVTASDISDFDEAAQDAVGGILVDGTTVDFTYTDGTPSITAEVKLATTSYLSTTGGLSVDKSSLETALVTDGFTKKVATNVGDGSATSFVITHGLGTQDVTVQIWSNDSLTRDQVEADVQIGEWNGSAMANTTTKITVSFTAIPALDAYRVVIVG